MVKKIGKLGKKVENRLGTAGIYFFKSDICIISKLEIKHKISKYVNKFSRKKFCNFEKNK